MNSPFAQIAAREDEKKSIRDAIEIIVRDALQHCDADLVAGKLVSTAYFMSTKHNTKRNGGAWMTPALESLRRLRDGGLQTEADILREIGDRNMSSGTRPPR